MSRRAIALAALAAALVTAPAALHAQSPLRFGLAAGATVPVGTFGDEVDWGVHVTGSVTGKPALSPVGIRGEVMWNRLTGKEFDTGLGTIQGDDVDVLAGIVNAEIGMTGVDMRPYLIGGLGAYRLSGEGEDDAVTKFGFNVGAGIDFALAGFSAFTEVRFHSIQTEGEARNIVPITFGIRF
jgi:hypothetical protein